MLTSDGKRQAALRPIHTPVKVLDAGAITGIHTCGTPAKLTRVRVPEPG